MKYFRTASASTPLEWSRFPTPTACLRSHTSEFSRLFARALRVPDELECRFRFLILAPDDVDRHYRRPFIKWKRDQAIREGWVVGSLSNGKIDTFARLDQNRARFVIRHGFSGNYLSVRFLRYEITPATFR